jgi:hypothetical protein
MASFPLKVNAKGEVGEGKRSEVRKRDSLVVVQEMPSPKMVIFNVHGTMLDCSLKVEKNPNSSIRSSVQTKSRRVVFRPRLIPFLSRCFMKFTIAFWWTKSEPYTQDIVFAVLSRLKGWETFDSLFVCLERIVRQQALLMAPSFLG